MMEKFVELADEDTLDLKDELMDVLDQHPTHTCIMSLTCALVETLAETAPSMERAVDAIATISATILASLRLFEEEGLCRWSSKIQ
jgi:hypothetical protein